MILLNTATSKTSASIRTFSLKLALLGERGEQSMSKITINGVPLEQYLGEVSTREAADLIMQAYRETVGEMAKIKPTASVLDRYDESTARVAKRVRHLTDKEIRKEYGIMSKPYKTKLENSLAHLKSQGPSSVFEIATVLEYKPRDVSTVMGRFFKRCPHLIEREKIAQNAFLYKLTDEGNMTSVEGMYAHYSKQKKSPRRVKPKDYKPELVMNDVDWAKVAPLKEEKPQPAGGPAEVVVRVEGEVKITFAFG
jgi:hypothetical protein